MRRTLVGTLLVALVVAPAWTSLATGGFPLRPVAVLAGLALLPGLVLALGRGLPLAGLALLATTFVALSVAFGLSLADARPFDPERNFFGPALSGLQHGVLEFFDTRVPFDPARFPLMHGAVLFGLFAFVAAAGLAIAARRPAVALVALVVGAGWPATMASRWIETSRPLLTGAVILGTALVLLVLLRERTRGLAHAAVAAVAVVAVAVAGSTSDAVAKRGFVAWDEWDLYDRPDDPVDVRYVWDANYDGISFPEKRTTVLKIKVAGPKRSLYWRATTLDDYTGRLWRESVQPVSVSRGNEPIDLAASDPLLPDAARDEDNWIRQDVRVEALKDARLVGSGQAVRWEPDRGGLLQLSENGAVLLDSPLERGERYTVWSYAPPAKPKELKEAGTAYPAAAAEYLRAFPADELEPLPAFGAGGRGGDMRRFFAAETYLDEGHRRMYEVARRVTREAPSPYEAAVLLEAWFRGSEGGFRYDEQPPLAAREPPLVAFLDTKRGYCQHFAGAMALMLRYLGVPARVAAGFTSGEYDAGTREWTVTDHNAHTWVEAYFPGFGWIPFDPTPNRGELTAAYTPFSPAFDVREAAGLGNAFQNVREIQEQIDRANALEQREGEAGGGGAAGPADESGGRGGGVFGFVLLLVAGGATALVAVKETRRRLRFAARDPRALASACRRDLIGYVADQGIEVPASATPRELGELVKRGFGVDAAPFVGALATARYGHPRDARAGTRAARRELRRLRRGIGRQLGLGQRLRGALSVRSLAR